jgi:biopolymer transport protein ExbD
MASVASDDSSQIGLNVMPMLDIFSILILFLLMSFSSDPVSHDVTRDLELPYSKTLISLDEIPTVIVSKNHVMVNDKKVARIVDGNISEESVSQGAVYPLFQELDKLAESNKRFKKVDDDSPLGLAMEFDKSLTFKVMKKVLLAAQQSDFIKLKLMVSKQL